MGKTGVQHVRDGPDAVVGVGPVPAGAALVSLLGFFFSYGPLKQTHSLKKKQTQSTCSYSAWLRGTRHVSH